MGLLDAFQKLPAPSLNSVPPTAILKGVEARPLTPCCVPEGALGESQPAAPLSPAETNAVIPCAAACDQRAFQKAFSAAGNAASQAPKLVLITGATLLLTMNCAERSTPSVANVD